MMCNYGRLLDESEKDKIFHICQVHKDSAQ